MTVRSYGDSYVGRRSNNEDALGKREPAGDALRDERGCLYIAADGMGGHAAGEIASGLAVETVLSEYYTGDRPAEETLVDAIREASRRIYHVAGDAIETEGMGCTVVACAVFEDRALIAHVGDSRAYLLRGGELSLLTEDHHAGAADEHILSRAVGIRPDVEVAVATHRLAPGDRLLLCTDGLSNAVPAAELNDSLRQPSPAEAIRALLQRAIDRKADDNSSAIVIELIQAPQPAGAEAGAGLEGEAASKPAIEVAYPVESSLPAAATIAADAAPPDSAEAEPKSMAAAAPARRRAFWRLFRRGPR